MKRKDAIESGKDTHLDLARLDRNGAEVDELSQALERAKPADAGFARQFVASGSGKCPPKPSF